MGAVVEKRERELNALEMELSRLHDELHVTQSELQRQKEKGRGLQMKLSLTKSGKARPSGSKLD